MNFKPKSLAQLKRHFESLKTGEFDLEREEVLLKTILKKIGLDSKKVAQCVEKVGFIGHEI